MWECKWENIFKKYNLLTSKRELEHLRCLILRDAYFEGVLTQSNCIKCTSAERIHYLDVKSMYPHVMSVKSTAFRFIILWFYKQTNMNFLHLKKFVALFTIELFLLTISIFQCYLNILKVENYYFICME